MCDLGGVCGPGNYATRWLHVTRYKKFLFFGQVRQSMRLSSGWGSRKCLETNYLRSKIVIRKDLRVDFKVSAPILVQTVDYVCGKTRDYGRLDGKQPSAVEADDNTARLSARLNSLVKKLKSYTKHRTGAKARHSFGCVCGLAEAMPLLQNNGLVKFLSKL